MYIYFLFTTNDEYFHIHLRIITLHKIYLFYKLLIELLVSENFIFNNSCFDLVLGKLLAFVRCKMMKNCSKHKMHLLFSVKIYGFNKSSKKTRVMQRA